MKLGIVTPWSSPFMWTGYVDSLLNMQHPSGYDVRYFRGEGWCPARRHIQGCEKALNWGADLICIVGADQVHPEDMFVRLVNRVNEGYEVVSALVPCRGYIDWQKMKPFQPMAWKFREQSASDASEIVIRRYRGLELDGDMVEIIDPRKGDMQRVNFIGSGVLMFHREHILSLRMPWFKETINLEDQQRTANMDSTFVWRLQTEAFATVWVDTTIKVKHIHPFPVDDTFQDRFMDWTKKGEGDTSVCMFKKEAPNQQGETP